MQNHLFCFGLGYTAQWLVKEVINMGFKVSGTTRSREKANALKNQGITAWLCDTGTPLSDFSTALDDVTHILISAPPKNDLDPCLHMHGSQLASICSQLQWIGYLSSIGVYGDHNGEWIDEDTASNPISKSGKQRLLAENLWLDFAAQHQSKIHIFRLPGIYGPGTRNQLNSLQAGHARRIIKPGLVFNRIHVEDIVGGVLATISQQAPSIVYNLCDDEPAAASDVVDHAARLLDMEPPPAEPIETANLSPFAAHFYAECKRVRNHRMKQELGVELKYKNYREGLEAIYQSGDF